MSASSSAREVLDPSVQELFADDPAGYAELSAIFVRSTAQRMAELEDACSHGASERIAEIAHALASSAESLGARRLGLACRTLERDPASGSAQLEQVRTELTAVTRRLPAAD
ncbi:MAG: Hpt domain-containing protein [Acidobacteriota bacterium]